MYSPFCYDGLSFSKPSWKGDRRSRRFARRDFDLLRAAGYHVRCTKFNTCVELLLELPGTLRTKDIRVLVDPNYRMYVQGRRKINSIDGHAVKAFQFSKAFSVLDDTLDVRTMKAFLYDEILIIRVLRRPVGFNPEQVCEALEHQDVNPKHGNHEVKVVHMVPPSPTTDRPPAKGAGAARSPIVST
uniref:SHSP domain-containing protein n=1 Tax=Grammatophora oceanica TaxID=210454 RepID=A0A6U5NR03_9STRA|mmetsp:Transcript_45511/g.67614  ORF Transcript_45511/g.67614 Transcript_45511/m.67614 type:complete len:186 (+) Transcript_45511:216-773(+)|eukprot:CAMPEP_0194065328 /NCGR_PEP_ID=MMETSP0009_2-20130614/85400_1 /TAXON_ID=210454 /ORGANISM="Grammatophora oceanica, Strain CCMP 410" /LENGTH=185 /DNA_ID=CAMNT_0038718147 /DNA_START=198 /DNA_END=755 /DNA_ORIENTATION=+